MKKRKGWAVIKNGALFDGTGSPLQPNSCVVIKDGLIQFAGPSVHAPEAPADALMIDARKGTIMPGLIEAHFHATYFNVGRIGGFADAIAVHYVAQRFGVPVWCGGMLESGVGRSPRKAMP